MSLRPIRAPLRAAVLGAGAILAAPCSATADPAPPFAALLQQALSAAPRLAESEAEIAQAEGLARQGAVRPNPTASLEVEDFGGSRPYNGLGQSQTTLAISQPLELGGKRSARIISGRAAVEAARARRDQSRADFAHDLALAYLDAEVAEARIGGAQEALTLAAEDARIARILVDAGKEAELRALAARSAVTVARAELEGARSQRETALAKLTALSGLPAPITSIPAGLLAHADRSEGLPRPDALASPTFIAAQAAREAAARRVRVEQTRATPDLTVGVGLRGYAGERAVGLVASVSAPLPVFDRNRGAVSAAQAELRAAEARLNAALLDTEADIRASLAQAGSAEARLASAREGERATEQAYRLTRLGYEGGKLPLSELTAARRTLAEARARTLDARLGRLTAEAALARLQGRAPFGDHP